jgi:UDP-N-acetylglucosamine:LPS N-acetylglucosamine transferase
LVKSQEYLVNRKKHLALIAPLDWGLGHTIRCIPIIRELIEQGFEVVIACNSEQRIVLSAEFAKLHFVNLTGYNVSYGRSRLSTILRIILQVPKILIAIKREQGQLKRILAQFTPNIIISDNRYGVFSSSIYSVFITHQLNILSGAGKHCDNLLRSATYKHIGRFAECWVPDFESGFTLGGRLSHPISKPPFKVSYIGPLSRLHRCIPSPDRTSSQTTSRTPVPAILAILSGPEPQRSALEKLLFHQLVSFNTEAIIVRGLPSETLKPVSAPNTSSKIRIIDFADSHELNRLICAADIVICRSGYTSVMDLFKLRKKAILIPTPGQTEQEYLGLFLAKAGFAVVADQNNFKIADAIKKLENLRPIDELIQSQLMIAPVVPVKASDLSFTGEAAGPDASNEPLNTFEENLKQVVMALKIRCDAKEDKK